MMPDTFIEKLLGEVIDMEEETMEIVWTEQDLKILLQGVESLSAQGRPAMRAVLATGAKIEAALQSLQNEAKAKKEKKGKKDKPKPEPPTEE